MQHRKFFALLLALALLLVTALPMSASAAPAGTNGTITVNPPGTQVLAPAEFFAYQLFEVTHVTSVSGRYQFAYRPLAPVENFLQWLGTHGTPAANLSTYDVTSNPNGTADDLAAACEQFRQWLQQDPPYAESFDEDNIIALAKVMINSGVFSAGGIPAAQDSDDKSVKFGNGVTGLDYGYYLVTGMVQFSDEREGVDTPHEGGKVISRAMLVNVPDQDNLPGVTIVLKADAPHIKKEVWQHSGATYDGTTVPTASTAGWLKWADISIGDTAYFKVSSKVPNMKGYSSYQFIVHDVMSKGLTFNPASIKIEISDPEGDGTTTVTYTSTNLGTAFNMTNPTITAEGPDQGGTAITITFLNFLTNNLAKKGWDITITYSAILNPNAVIADKGNPNDVRLEYSRNPNWDGNGDEPTGKTPWDRVRVYTYKLDIFKYTGTLSPTNPGLANAKFELRKGSDDGALVYFIGSNGNYTVQKTSIAADAVLVSPTGGLINIKGLDAGTYYLIETAAPVGFNIKTTPDKIVITKGDIDPSSKAVTYRVQVNDGPNNLSVAVGAKPGDVNILNQTGHALPGTGGIGLYVILAVGAVMAVLLTVGYIVYRKRKTLGILKG